MLSRLETFRIITTNVDSIHTIFACIALGLVASCYCCKTVYTYVYLPTSTYLPTYISIPTYLYQHTYLPMSTYHIYQTLSTYHHLHTYINIPTYLPRYTNLPSSTYIPLPITKYQYIIATDPGADISLVTFEKLYVGYTKKSMFGMGLCVCLQSIV